MNTPVMHIAIVAFIKLQILSFVYREKVFLSYMLLLDLMSLMGEGNGLLQYSISSFAGNYSQEKIFSK